MDENNNFFGFVSKIGSLINNNKTKEKETKKKSHEKKYNIKISTDDEEGLDDIANESDEEEEEEEEEEDKKEKEEKKDEEKNPEESKKQEEENLEKEKIKNIVKEIMDNNDNNKDDNIDNDNDIDNNEEEKEEDIEDNINNINNSNNNVGKINNNKITMCPPILNNSFPTLNINSENDNKTFFYDETTSCHIMLKKGNDININDYIVFPILFMEKQKNILYKMRMMNNPAYEPKNYLFFFDEHYLYFAKDEIKVEEMDEETRRISKIISLFDIKDFSADNDNENREKFLIKILVKKEDKEKEINFYIEEKYFAGFIKNFNLKLSIYGIDFFSNKKN